MNQIQCFGSVHVLRLLNIQSKAYFALRKDFFPGLTALPHRSPNTLFYKHQQLWVEPSWCLNLENPIRISGSFKISSECMECMDIHFRILKSRIKEVKGLAPLSLFTFTQTKPFFSYKNYFHKNHQAHSQGQNFSKNVQDLIFWLKTFIQLNQKKSVLSIMLPVLLRLSWLRRWKNCCSRVILILMKFGISISTWFQVVPFCSQISELFLFSLYDLSFRCPYFWSATSSFTL